MLTRFLCLINDKDDKLNNNCFRFGDNKDYLTNINIIDLEGELAINNIQRLYNLYGITEDVNTWRNIGIYILDNPNSKIKWIYE